MKITEEQGRDIEYEKKYYKDRRKSEKRVTARLRKEKRKKNKRLILNLDIVRSILSILLILSVTVGFTSIPYCIDGIQYYLLFNSSTIPQYVSLFSLQVTLIFLTTTLVSGLSQTGNYIFWKDIAKESLIEPPLLNFKFCTVYAIVSMIISVMGFIHKKTFFIFWGLILAVVIITYVLFKTIMIYFSEESQKKKLYKRYKRANDEQKRKYMLDMLTAIEKNIESKEFVRVYDDLTFIMANGLCFSENSTQKDKYRFLKIALETIKKMGREDIIERWAMEFLHYHSEPESFDITMILDNCNSEENGYIKYDFADFVFVIDSFIGTEWLNRYLELFNVCLSWDNYIKIEQDYPRHLNNVSFDNIRDAVMAEEQVEMRVEEQKIWLLERDIIFANRCKKPGFISAPLSQFRKDIMEGKGEDSYRDKCNIIHSILNVLIKPAVNVYYIMADMFYVIKMDERNREYIRVLYLMMIDGCTRMDDVQEAKRMYSVLLGIDEANEKWVKECKNLNDANCGEPLKISNFIWDKETEYETKDIKFDIIESFVDQEIKNEAKNKIVSVMENLHSGTNRTI